MSKIDASRRGILGLFGAGVAAGPAFVKEALSNKVSLPGRRLGNIGVGVAKNWGEGNGNALEEMMEDENDSVGYSKEGCTNEEGKSFTHNYIQKLRYKLRAEAELEYIKKSGIPVKKLIEAGQFAVKKLDSESLPSHIKSLKSFSDVRKRQMAYDWYMERYLKQYVLGLELAVEEHDIEEKKERYQRLFKRSKASFLGNLINRIL